MNTIVLPDPLLTQGSPVTFLACALLQLFVRSCVLAHCVCTHRSSSQHLPFRCLPLLSFRAHMDEPQGMRLPLGTTEWHHSYYTGNSLSALHSLQQLQAGATSPSPVQMSASTRESHGAAPSSSVSRPQVTLSATHPQVQTDPTRTITSDLLSATLAEAATPLSFAAFLERCIFVNASPPLQLPVPTPPLDAATQTFHAPLPLGTFLRNSRSGSSWLHLLRTMLSALRVLDQSPFYFLMRLCRRLLYSVGTHAASTQLPLTEFFIGRILSNDPSDRQASPSAHCNAGSASPPQPADIATL